MRDLLLQCSGFAAIAVALIHGVLGETKVFARATIEPPRLRTLIRLVWQAGTVAWIGGGVLLIAAPWMASEPARHWIVVTHGRRVCVWRAGQRLGDARPAFRLDGAERRGRAGGGGILMQADQQPSFRGVRSTNPRSRDDNFQIPGSRWRAPRNDYCSLTAAAGRRWCVSWPDPSR